MKMENFCQLEFTKDHEGKEMLLKEGKFQVMMEWEKPYMQACIDALQPTGDVLEVGFGCGYASSHIQTYRPRSHTIIEYHPLVVKRAKEWAAHYANVILIEDTWQNALKDLGQYDAIFFDDYPLESGEEGLKTQESKKRVHTILEQGQKTLESIHEKLPFLKSLNYTQEDIDDFLSLASRDAEPLMFLRFFSDLKKNRQIDESRFQYALQRLLEQKIATPELLERFLKKEEDPPFLFRHQGDRLFLFLQLCLNNHMRPGARFSCYLEEPKSKFEDEKFFNQIITNPFLEYTEKTISVEVPAHCAYYKGNEALVITIKKL